MVRGKKGGDSTTIVIIMPMRTTNQSRASHRRALASCLAHPGRRTASSPVMEHDSDSGASFITRRWHRCASLAETQASLLKKPRQ